jgi:hypothetical protein
MNKSRQSFASCVLHHLVCNMSGLFACVQGQKITWRKYKHGGFC